MSNEQESILGTAPLGAEDIVATFDLYSEETPLGGPDSPIKIKEGTVELGKAQVKFLPAGTEPAVVTAIIPDRKKWDLYLIEQPFALHNLPTDRYYQTLTFHLALADTTTTAFDLFPQSVTSKEEVKKVVTVGLDFKFQDIEVKAGEISSQVVFERLRPSISVTGIGQHQFYWTYTGQKDIGIIPETKRALIILQVPTNTRVVSGQVHYQATIAERWLGLWTMKDANSAYLPIRWELQRSM